MHTRREGKRTLQVYTLAHASAAASATEKQIERKDRNCQYEIIPSQEERMHLSHTTETQTSNDVSLPCVVTIFFGTIRQSTTHGRWQLQYHQSSDVGDIST